MANFAYAEEELSVPETSLLEFEGEYSSDTGYFFAKIENNSEVAVAIDSGTLVAFKENDEILLTMEYIGSSPSGVVLEPGEYIYAKDFLWDDALESANVTDYQFSVSTKETGRQLERISCEATYEIAGNDENDNYVYVTFTNTTDETRYDFYISSALHDAEGNLIFVETQCASDVALHPGSTVTVKMYVDKEFVEYYEENGIEPASVDAMVYYEVE